MTVLNSRQVIRMTGVSAQRLAYWVQTGVVRPSVEDSRGRKGRQRRWTGADVQRIAAISCMRDAGINLQRAAAAADGLLSFLQKNRTLF